MAYEPLRAPLNPQTKSHSPALSVSSAPSRTSSNIRPAPPNKSKVVTSDGAAEAFVRRVLCPQAAQHGQGQDTLPISALLPPLTSSNQVDVQLYAIIAIILKDVVYSWYSKITPDHTFVDEIVHIIAHCTRALEERARRADLEILLLDELPALFDAHVTAYRAAAAACLSESSAEANTIYHALRPHPALEPVPRGSDATNHREMERNFQAYCRMLSQGLLAVLLPVEDLHNPALRGLVSEVVADLILGTLVGKRICEDVFLYEAIRQIAEAATPKAGGQPWAVDTTLAQPSRLSQFGLVSNKGKTLKKRRMTIAEWVNVVFQYLWMAIAGIRGVIMALVHSPSLPSRRETWSGVTTPQSGVKAPVYPTKAPPKAIAAYQLWPALGRYLSLSTRMPWLAGIIALADHHLLRGSDRFGMRGEDGRLDRLLAHHLLTPFQTPSEHLSSLLCNARLALFPGNTLLPPPAPGPIPAPPTPKAASRAAAFAILSALPRPLARALFLPRSSAGDGIRSMEQAAEGEEADAKAARDRADIEAMVAEVQASLLDVWSNEYMNRGLLLAVVERVVVALVPELGRGEEGLRVGELLAARGVGG